MGYISFHWWAGAVCLKTLMYSYFNYRTNCRTMPHRRCVSIDVLAFTAVLPYYVWKTSINSHSNQYGNGHGELRHRRAPSQ